MFLLQLQNTKVKFNIDERLKHKFRYLYNKSLVNVRFYGAQLLVICRKHLYDSTISLRKAWAQNASLTTPRLIEVPVPSQESEQSCIFVLRVSILPLSTTLIFDFGIFPAISSLSEMLRS